VPPGRTSSSHPTEDQAVFLPAFTLAHRALCAAAIFLRADAESVRFRGIGTTFAVSRTFAHRARWAAAILVRVDADSFLVPFPLLYAVPKAASAAPMPRSSLVNRSCSFFNRRITPAKLDIEFPLARDCIKIVRQQRQSIRLVGRLVLPSLDQNASAARPLCESPQQRVRCSLNLSIHLSVGRASQEFSLTCPAEEFVALDHDLAAG
jgi:hypothetical protein